MRWLGLGLVVLLAGCPCPPTRVSLTTTEPVPFVAFVDGDGAWTRVGASSPGVYEVEVDSDRWGVAWVCGTAAIAVLLAIDEATDLAEPCLAADSTATIEGEVLGLADQESARIVLSLGGATLPLGATMPGFQLDAPDRELDLAVQVLDPDAATTRVILDRGRQGSATGLAYDALDAVPLESHQATATGDVVGPPIFSMLVTRTGQIPWFGAGADADRILSLPADLLEPDDIQVVIAMEPGFVDGDGRRVEVWRESPGDEVLPFPDGATAPPIEVIPAASGVRVRATTPNDADAFWLYAFQDELEPLPPRVRAQSLLATRGWIGDVTGVGLVFPPVHELEGWPADVVLTEIGLRWRFSSLHASGGATAHLPGHQPRLPEGDGVVRSWAASSGFVEAP